MGTSRSRWTHEQFGDGIMSAIHCRVEVEKRPHKARDRTVVTFDGKLLSYASGPGLVSRIVVIVLPFL
jgi:cyanate lyase